MGFGTELLFILMLGMLVLGPKRLHTMVGHIARAKARFEEASRSFQSQLAAELDAAPRDGRTDRSHESVKTNLEGAPNREESSD
jgi:Sec-independent protein translocase protein TatA